MAVAPDGTLAWMQTNGSEMAALTSRRHINSQDPVDKCGLGKGSFVRRAIAFSPNSSQAVIARVNSSNYLDIRLRGDAKCTGSSTDNSLTPSSLPNGTTYIDWGSSGIAYTRNISSSNNWIEVVNTSGSTTHSKQLPNNISSIGWIDWSPDGSKILYSANTVSYTHLTLPTILLV